MTQTTSTPKASLLTAQAHLEPTGTPHSGTPDIDTRHDGVNVKFTTEVPK